MLLIRRRLVPDESAPWETLTGVSNSEYLEIAKVNETEVRDALKNVLDAGITSIAVVLAHAYACPSHEVQVGAVAKELGFQHIVLSHETMPMIRVVNRGHTASAEAYLTPHVERYLDSFTAGFRDKLRGVDILFMQSDGGLARMQDFRGARAILSGPAGGVVGYGITGSRDTDQPLIGFDMGGTSTDVSRFADGKYEHVVESTTAGVTIQAPQLDINTVAAGGGSMLFFRSGLFVVGPESASAHPGPACYRKGGPLTVTDANLMLGRLLPEHFPHIFGPNETEPLDYEAARGQFEALREEINAFLLASGQRAVRNGRKLGKTRKILELLSFSLRQTPLTLEEVAMGFIRVANEAMCRPIRALTQARGYDTTRHVLACFGGAGGQHACGIARELGMRRVVIHKYAGILSAYGMALADVVHEVQEPCGLDYDWKNFAKLQAQLDVLVRQCRAKLLDQGFDEAHTEIEPFLHLRYEGTDLALMCKPATDGGSAASVTGYGDFYDTFLKRYKSEFGFVCTGRTVKVDDIRVRGSGKSSTPTEADIDAGTGAPKVTGRAKTHFDGLGHCEVDVVLSTDVRHGHQLHGPLILIDKLSTIVIEPNCRAVVTQKGDFVIDVGSGNAADRRVDSHLDAVQLSIFSHRFMSIAEQMGRVLQRTAISTNIKERLDFSCAIFGPDGGLVSNAPHIPVHLGAMQESVRYQLKMRGKSLKRGDVLLSNHPMAGGSHLPDMTVITPVFFG